MSYECDNDNHDIGCQCPGLPPPAPEPQAAFMSSQFKAGMAVGALLVLLVLVIIGMISVHAL